eukprot:6685477-Prymnesium_polylepis.1
MHRPSKRVKRDKVTTVWALFPGQTARFTSWATCRTNAASPVSHMGRGGNWASSERSTIGTGACWPARREETVGLDAASTCKESAV